MGGGGGLCVCNGRGGIKGSNSVHHRSFNIESLSLFLFGFVLLFKF